MTERPFNPGSAWIAPKLYRFDGVPASWEIVVARTWPDPRAWRKTSGGPDWMGCRPWIDLQAADRVLPAGARRRARCEQQAALQVPREIRGPVAQINPNAQWAVLSMAARVEGALDLIQSAPGLAMGLANSFKVRKGVKRPIRSARVQIRRRRREIAGWLGFPETEASVKAIAKLERDDRIPQDLTKLRSLLRSGEPWLAHLAPLRSDVLMVLLCHRKERDRLSLRLLEEITDLPSRRERYRVSHRIYQALTLGPQLLRRGKVPKLSGLARLEEVNAEIDELSQRKQIAQMKQMGPFPVPPYPDQLIEAERPIQLRAITDAQALVEHGVLQRNCIANQEYVERIQGGTGYAYELSWTSPKGKPARATLFVDGRGILRRRWGVEDVRLSCNRRPGKWLIDEAVRIVRNETPARLPAPEVIPAEVPPRPEVDERQMAFGFLEGWPAGPYADVEDVPF